MIADLIQLITDVLGGSVTGILGFALVVFNTLVWDPTLNASAGGFTDLFQFMVAMSIILLVLTIAIGFTKRF